MKKTIIALLGAGALVLAPVAASATVPNPPAEEECIPQDAWTETIEHPAVGEPTITIDNPDYVPGTEGSAAVWANFSPNDSQATFIGPPTYPTDDRGTWHDHGQLPPGQAGPDGVYANGNPDKGGNWFYRQAAVPGTPAVGEPTKVVDNPDYVPAKPDTVIEHPAVECEEPEEPEEEPEVPDAVTKYSPVTSVTCEAATFSHPAYKGAFGVATGYHVWMGPEQKEAQASDPITVAPGQTVTYTFDDPTVNNTAYFEIKLSYDGYDFQQLIGQSRVKSEGCDLPPEEEPEEPEVPGDDEQGETPGDDEKGEETPADDDDKVETIRVVDGKGKALTIEVKKLSVNSPTPPVQVDAGLAETGTGGYTALAFGIALIASGAVLAAKRAFRA